MCVDGEHLLREPVPTGNCSVWIIACFYLMTTRCDRLLQLDCMVVRFLLTVMLIFACLDRSFSDVYLKRCRDGEQGLLCAGRDGQMKWVEVSPASLDHVTLLSQEVWDVESDRSSSLFYSSRSLACTASVTYVYVENIPS